MDKKLRARRNAFSAVQKIIDFFAAIWAGYKPYENANTDFNTDVKNIDEAEEIQARLIKGYTTDKRIKRETMADMALSVQGKVANWAIARGDTVLAGKMKYSRSKFMYTPATIARVAAELIYDAAINIPAVDKVEFELTAAVTDGYRLVIDDFVEVMSSPRVQIAIRSYATERLPLLFKKATDTLDLRLTNLMERYRNTNPDFFQQFLNAKIIIDNIRHTTVEGLVLDKETGEGLNKVKVVFTSSEKQFEEMTDSEGKYKGSELNPELDWKVKFVLPGFREEELEFNDLKRGEHDVVNVELVKQL